MDAYCNDVNKLTENQKLNFSQLYISKKLSIDEIKMNLSIFLMAGSESTSIALTVLFHILATMPEEQEKLLHEIDQYFPIDGQVKFLFINNWKCLYLDHELEDVNGFGARRLHHGYLQIVT